MTRVFDGSTNSNSGNVLQPADYFRLVRTHVRWWAVPAIAFTLIAGAYTFVAPRQWKATQALVIRPEVASISEERLGKFTDLSEMKTTQETILELAKSQNVIGATLREVGPPHGYSHPADWPTALDVEAFRDHLDMRPPGGAEFGKTEVFYLTISNSNRDRASAMVVALCTQLERRMQDLRGQSARGMIAELERTVAMADGDLAGRTEKLSSFEANVGAELAELRTLNADSASQGEVSLERQAIEGERRANEARQNESERLLKLLVAAQNDPQQLLATPNSLLVSQPSVSQLKNALINAQLHTSSLLSSYSGQHPYVLAAQDAETFIRGQLNNEVAVAIRGLQVDIELCADREKSLAGKWSAARERMSRLAAGRAEYASLVSSVQNHTRLVESARKNLADARARLAGAHSASVISRIDGVEAGIRPAGPSRKTVAAAGGVGGLLFGFGLIFLFANPAPVSAKVPVAMSDLAEVMDASNDINKPTSHRAEWPAVEVAVGSVSNGAKGTGPVVHRAPTVNESFGMFRGMSLLDAVRTVEGRRK